MRPMGVDVYKRQQLYGARVAETGIEDHFGNQTSFALIGRQGHVPVLTGSKFKTSLALFLQTDRPGALLMICLLYTSRTFPWKRLELPHDALQRAGSAERTRT